MVETRPTSKTGPGPQGRHCGGEFRKASRVGTNTNFINIMAGQKTFINNTKQTINVTLLIRQGNDIQKPSLEQEFQIAPGEKKPVTYGSSTNIYLNGLVFEWKDTTSQSLNNDRQEVIATGVAPTFDWVLNTHSIITINAVSGLNITGSN